MTRRLFLNFTLMLGAVATFPSALLAKRNESAFTSSDVMDAMKKLYGTSKTLDGNIKIKAPKIAENGAAVPITVSSTSKDISSIALFVEGNPRALVSVVEVGKNTVPNFSTRIKLSKTANVVAVAKIGNKLYSTRKNIKVTIGGCGG